MNEPLSQPSGAEDSELSVEELLRWDRPLPPYPEMVIEDLTPEEGEAFMKAVLS